MDVLKSEGQLDVLFYYSKVSEKLGSFMKGKMLASRVWIPNGSYLIKRGSKLEPLYIEDMKISKEFLRMRTKNLADVKNKLTKKQILLWNYFVPRKLADFFYATNDEGAGRPLDRIFFDIDRGRNVSAEDALEVTAKLIENMKSEKEPYFKKPFIMWTGSSFHIYLFTGKKPASFYNQFRYSKSDPTSSLTGRWAAEIKKDTGINVRGGHDKNENWINIDPSQTPSGKLARAPFSLHIKGAKTVDGIALPVTEKDFSKGLLKKLESYTAEKTLKELGKLSRKLP